MKAGQSMTTNKPEKKLVDNLVEQEIVQLMTTIHDDVAEIRNMVDKVSEVKGRISHTLERLSREFDPHDNLVRNAKAFATWAEHEADDVIFCKPAETPTAYLSMMEDPTSISPETKGQKAKRERRELEAMSESHGDEAMIDLDKLDVTIPPQN